MSHNRDIIIQSLRGVHGITSTQQARLDDIGERHEMTIVDRLYLAWLTYQLTGANE